MYNPNGTAVTSANVSFKVEIWDSTATCRLYSEVHAAQDLSTTKGGFSLVIGTGSSPNNYLDNTTVFSSSLFKNPGTSTSVTGCGSSIVLTSGSDRLIRVSYDLSGGSTFVAMNPDVPIVSAPYAMVAETLQGKSVSDFILTNVNTMLSQSNMEYLFTNTNYTNLKALVDGNSTQYMSASPSSAVSFGSQRLINVADPSGAQDVATKNYSDTKIGGKSVNMTGLGVGTGNGRTLMWDAGTGSWVTSALGSVGYIEAGTGLTGGPITSSGTLSVDVGTAAGQILQLNPSAQIPAVNGSLLMNVNAMALQSRALSAVAPNDGQVFTWNNTASEWQPMTPSGGTVTGLSGDVTGSGSGVIGTTISNDVISSAKINSTGIAVNRLLITDSTNGTTVGYMTCNVGEILHWTLSGWGCVSVSSALGNSGVTAGTYGSGGFVPQVTVDAQGRVTALTNINIDFPVTTVAGRTGTVTLNASDIGGLGSVATKNVGVAANEIVQLDGSAKLPAVDASALTNVNATKLQSQTVSANVPTAGQVLSWNAAGSQWEPMNAATGSVTGIVSGTGLVSGTISSYGTINVDVGTTGGKILQLTGGAQIPAVDGYLVTNSNAYNIRGRGVATSSPSGGQVLTWNAASGLFDYQTPTTGTVTQITSGTGLIAGTINGVGTINVDVGTTGNKILQLASGQIPAVDGNLVTNVNAVKLQTRNVSTAAPGTGQVLGWNGLSSQWEPMSTAVGSVVSVQTGTGLTGGNITSSGTISVDVGTGSNQIVQLNASSQLPSVDGSLLNNVNASNLSGNVVKAGTPSNGQILTWNATGSQWESQDPASVAFPLVANPTGSAATPAYTFSGSTGTGMYSATADNLGLATSGVQRLKIDQLGNVTINGNVGIGTTTPAALLDVNGTARFGGGLNAKVRVATAAGAITVTTSDYIICVNKSSGAATTINLPASPALGDQYVIKDCKGDAATNNITVTPNAGNIDGAGTYVLNINRQSAGIFYDGTQWQVF